MLKFNYVTVGSRQFLSFPVLKGDDIYVPWLENISLLGRLALAESCILNWSKYCAWKCIILKSAIRESNWPRNSNDWSSIICSCILLTDCDWLPDRLLDSLTHLFTHLGRVQTTGKVPVSDKVSMEMTVPLPLETLPAFTSRETFAGCTRPAGNRLSVLPVLSWLDKIDFELLSVTLYCVGVWSAVICACRSHEDLYM